MIFSIYTRPLASVCMILALLCSPVFGEGPASDPDATVRSMVAAMQSGKGFAGLMEFVHWPTAFETVEAEQRAAMGIDSPEALRETTLAFLTDPGKALEKQLVEQLKDTPKEEAERLQQFLAEQQKRLQLKLKATERRMAESTYAVGEATVDEETAVVGLAATFQGQTSERKIVLRQIDGLWYLPSGDLGGVKPENLAPVIEGK